MTYFLGFANLSFIYDLFLLLKGQGHVKSTYYHLVLLRANIISSKDQNFCLILPDVPDMFINFANSYFQWRWRKCRNHKRRIPVFANGYRRSSVVFYIAVSEYCRGEGTGSIALLNVPVSITIQYPGQGINILSVFLNILDIFGKAFGKLLNFEE